MGTDFIVKKKIKICTYFYQYIFLKNLELPQKYISFLTRAYFEFPVVLLYVPYHL